VPDRGAGYVQTRQERSRGSLWDDIEHAADEFGDRVAVVGATELVTFRNLARSSELLAARLIRLGLRGGDRVVVQVPPRPSTLRLCLALFRIGAVPVAASLDLREDDIAKVAEFTSARAYASVSHVADFDYQQLARVLSRRVPDVAHVLIAGGLNRGVLVSNFIDLDGWLSGALPADAIAAALYGVGPEPGDVATLEVVDAISDPPVLVSQTHAALRLAVRAQADLPIAVRTISRPEPLFSTLAPLWDTLVSGPGWSSQLWLDRITG
jgi:2,3-dihydroxybenzoate-AMP ligase